MQVIPLSTCQQARYIPQSKDHCTVPSSWCNVKVQKALRKLSPGITTMIIAFRLRTVYRADKILVLKDRMVMQIGKHVDMVSKPSPYHEP